MFTVYCQLFISVLRIQLDLKFNLSINKSKFIDVGIYFVTKIKINMYTEINIYPNQC
jgi:hypothetical protein